MSKYKSPLGNELWISQTYHTNTSNKAVDFGSTPVGTPVYAMANGVIGTISSAYGSYLTLDVDNSDHKLFYVHVYKCIIVYGFCQYIVFLTSSLRFDISKLGGVNFHRNYCQLYRNDCQLCGGIRKQKSNLNNLILLIDGELLMVCMNLLFLHLHCLSKKNSSNVTKY